MHSTNIKLTGIYINPVFEGLTYYTFSMLVKSERAQTDENYSVSDTCGEGERIRWRDDGITENDAGE
jgi:hypothetical protein